jgi:hypothetical protein
VTNIIYHTTGAAMGATKVAKVLSIYRSICRMEETVKAFEQKNNSSIVKLIENYRVLLQNSRIAHDDIADHERLQMEAATANIVRALNYF